MKAAFREIVDKLKKYQGTEQPLFDLVLCGSKESVRHADDGRCDKGSLTVVTLDRFQFPNGYVKVGPMNQHAYSLSKHEFEAYTKKPLLAAHNNYVKGVNKYARQQRAHRWFLSGEVLEDGVKAGKCQFGTV
eukprot:SAG31_NODE_7836_length_1586_cov_1.170814_2_plen_132_part_00